MSFLWASAIAAPIAIAAVLGLLIAYSGGGRAIDLWVRSAPLSLIPFAVLAIVGPAAGPIELPWLMLGTHLTMDFLARPLLLVAVLLYAAAMIAAHSSRTDRAHILVAYLLVCFVGNALVFVAADTVTFYLGFAVMSIAAYGLVIHERSAAAQRAGRVYIVLAVAGEMVILAALLLVVDAGGLLLADAPVAVAESSHRELIVLLLLVGFGVKAGTVPLHVWLPLAHPAAPPPASAVLSGSMIKAGLVGWLRFLPLGEVAMPGWGTALIVVALVGAFAALLPGLFQNDAKVALAYSSISQMGFLAVLVGVALAEPDIAPVCAFAAVVYAVHHGMAKGGLFLGVTVWRTHGEGWIRWWVIGGLTFLALAVAGAPFGSGAVAKYAAKEAVDPATLWGVNLVSLLPFVGTVSTLLLLRAGWLLLTGDRDRAWGVDGAVVSWSVLIVGGTVLTWVLALQWSPILTLPGFELSAVWAAAWPILLGMALAAAGWWRSSGSRRWRIDGWQIPPGDILLPEEKAARAMTTHLASGARYVGSQRARWSSGFMTLAERGPSPVKVVTGAERRISSWVGSGAVTVALMGALLILVVGIW
ncbi:formate hydrogenlyase [Hoyosella rhizosphaerae]|uniref:NADH:quinone oxidoreductase/Mrp antiporter transmembrane domain-containing protein n=1 Tax=Hoyosella rhizosphaerae TaxID=1755582 RepID=A0A916U5A2_9ACTN|nr:proton-conducting transporter membrane subunit [Hoyosella rhizosphaerae]MBN4926207.1 formate hydrogenlyase [Hoyosella rhizosphaerae]GGC61238.1 hypothetical protein GCM10011410_12140 [Hoyosella rhizosphaerae]